MKNKFGNTAKRLYVYIMKTKEPRKVRGYKITDKRYKAAQKRAKKDDIPLATYIEMFVTLLGNGDADIAIKDRGWLPLKSMAGDFINGSCPSKTPRHKIQVNNK